MKLEAYVKKNPPKTGGNRCRSCQLLTPALDAELRAARAADPSTYQYTVLSKYLEDEHKIAIKDATLRKHVLNCAPAQGGKA